MNLMEGKIYLTRNGQQIEILSKEDPGGTGTNIQYSGIFLDATKQVSWWYEGGHWNNHKRENPLDIVSLAVPEGEIDMAKVNGKYALIFRKSPTDDFRYENFEERKTLFKRHKKTLKNSSNFRVLERQEDGKYKTIYTKKSMVDAIVQHMTKLIIENGNASKVYIALKKVNDKMAEELKR